MTDATAYQAARRAALAERAVALRRAGKLNREIAAELGVSISYASTLHVDPTGTKDKRRKDSYREPCPNCGRLKDGSNGRNGNAPKHCAKCAPLFATFWTRDAIIDTIKDFNDQYGRLPTARDWNPAMAIAQGRTDIADRFYEDGCWPTTSILQARFGSWNAAIREAGFEPMPAGHKYSDILTPEMIPDIVARYRGGESTYMLAEDYGVANSSIAQALERGGCKRRTISEAQALAKALGRRGEAA